MMNDEEIMDAYEADMKFRDLLPNTIAVRRRYLRKFSREVGFGKATEQGVIVWLGRDISSKTRAMWLSTLNSLYVFCETGDGGDPIFPRLETNDGKQGDHFNPIRKIKKPRLHGNRPRPMPDDDINLAIANADPIKKCWLLLGAYCGARCQEIAFIEREDIDEDNGTLLITHGKGAKSRYVPLHPDVLDALKQMPWPTSGRLWDETAASISRKGNRYLHSLNIKSTMHTLRHWAGTHFYRASRDLIATQNLLGHSSPQTTSVYAAADMSKSASIVGALNIDPAKFRAGVEALDAKRNQ